MAWLLQLLDTHEFAKCKRYLKTGFQDIYQQDQEPIPTLRMVRLVIDAIRAVLQGYRWGRAFASNGLTGDQDRVSAFIRGELESERLPLYQPVPPYHRDLALMMAFKPKGERSNCVAPFA